MGRPVDKGKRETDGSSTDEVSGSASTTGPSPSSTSPASASTAAAAAETRQPIEALSADQTVLSAEEVAMLSEFIPGSQSLESYLLVETQQLQGNSSGGEVGVLVSALCSCPHVSPSEASSSSSTFFPIITSFPQFDSKCSDCQDASENWMCLHCGVVGCGRYTNGHMLQHTQQTGHPVAFGFRDLSVWCFHCDSYLDALHIQELRPAFQELHRMKFGTNPPLPEGEQRTLGGPPS